ncbi:hypothetical protein I5M27_10695 [Adhaeribacter sp. BT258]|uniref:Uncharacterized protein n=2 Tax=Adhaeribacter terrigena TaxID=2793070 RepID=A0ABS1C2A4_9BACT|nr:hypothetical protein [Adhaeribacter terrigena]
MQKYITVKNGDEAGAKKIKEYRVACHQQKKPCVIITQFPDHADISCDNWLSTDDAIITVENRMMLEDQFQQLQRKHPETEIVFSTSEVETTNISNPIPLWYHFKKVPLPTANTLAEKIHDIYQQALPYGF